MAWTVDEIYISNTSKLRRLNLYSLSGQRVMDIQNPGERLDVSQLSEGVYLMELIGIEGERSMQKIVKQ